MNIHLRFVRISTAALTEQALLSLASMILYFNLAKTLNISAFGTLTAVTSISYLQINITRSLSSYSYAKRPLDDSYNSLPAANFWNGLIVSINLIFAALFFLLLHGNTEFQNTNLVVSYFIMFCIWDFVRMDLLVHKRFSRSILGSGIICLSSIAGFVLPIDIFDPESKVFFYMCCGYFCALFFGKVGKIKSVNFKHLRMIHIERHIATSQRIKLYNNQILSFFDTSISMLPLIFINFIFIMFDNQEFLGSFQIALTCIIGPLTTFFGSLGMPMELLIRDIFEKKTKISNIYRITFIYSIFLLICSVLYFTILSILKNPIASFLGEIKFHAGFQLSVPAAMFSLSLLLTNFLFSQIRFMSGWKFSLFLRLFCTLFSLNFFILLSIPKFNFSPFTAIFWFPITFFVTSVLGYLILSRNFNFNRSS